MIEFDQSEEIKKYSEDEVDNEGICWALSMIWLKLALEGKSDNSGRIGTLRSWVEKGIGLQRLYAKFHKETDTSSFSNPGVVKAGGLVQLLGAKLGLTIDKSVKKHVLKTTTSSLENLDDIVSQILTPGTGHMLSFQYSNGTGHAMATRTRSSGFWYTVSNEIFLFDPNAGEANVSGSGLKIFLATHMKNNNANTLLIIKVKKV